MRCCGINYGQFVVVRRRWIYLFHKRIQVRVRGECSYHPACNVKSIKKTNPTSSAVHFSLSLLRSLLLFFPTPAPQCLKSSICIDVCLNPLSFISKVMNQLHKRSHLKCTAPSSGRRADCLLAAQC